MSNISTYSGLNSPENDLTYAKVSSNTQKVQLFAQQLHDLLPVLEKEFDELEDRQKVSPNEIFPIKMAALSSIYKAAEPLYKWYVENAKRVA